MGGATGGLALEKHIFFLPTISLAGAGGLCNAVLISWIARARQRAQHAPVSATWGPDFGLDSGTFWHFLEG